jgi:hypothetical protein
MSKNRLYLLAIGMAIAGYLLVFYNVQKKENTKVQSLCMLKNITGIPCPACGTTRSVTSLAKGEFSKAFLINPLGYLAAGMLILFPLIILLDIIQKKDRFYRLFHKADSFFKKRWIAIISILIILANWCWNIYKEL